MKRTLIKIAWLAVLLVCAAAGPDPAASSQPLPSQPLPSQPLPSHDLLAHGDEQHFWIAKIQPATSSRGFDQTQLMYRGSFGEPWTSLPDLPARAVRLASSSGELWVVLDNGQCWIADEDGFRAILPPPRDASVVALGNDREALWALVLTTPNSVTQHSATASAAAPPSKTASPNPVSSPASAEKVLVAYRLSGDHWDQPVLLPPDVPRTPGWVSMTVIGRWPMIAWGASGHHVLVSRLLDQKWTAPQEVPGAVAADFKIFNLQDRPALWIVPLDKPHRPSGKLFIGDDFKKTLDLPLTSADRSDLSAQTLAVAFQRLRWLGIADGKMLEQAFELDGHPAGQVKPIAGPQAQVIPLVPCIMAALIVVLVAMVVGLRQKNAQAAASADPSFGPLTIDPKLDPRSRDEILVRRLAPIGVRMAAGLVDLLPCLAALAIVNPAMPNGSPASVDERSRDLVILLAIFTYIAHTCAAEVLCGQSFGKTLFDLHVLGRDGQAPSRLSIIVRNAMRAADLIGLPLLSVLFTPLRQRVGDLAAGTVVVTEDVPDEGQ